jgi:hypothetical protein
MDGNVTDTKEKEIRELHNRIVVLEKLEELIKIENKFEDWKA